MDPIDAKDAAKLFSVPDFAGDACKAITSHVKGAVAGVQFDNFHKVCVSDWRVYMSVCMFMTVYVCLHMCAYVSVFVYMSVYACICVSVCINL